MMKTYRDHMCEIALDYVKKYKTIHSITDDDTRAIINHAKNISDFKYFLDFGCHFGHLSIALAICWFKGIPLRTKRSPLPPS